MERTDPIIFAACIKRRLRFSSDSASLLPKPLRSKVEVVVPDELKARTWLFTAREPRGLFKAPVTSTGIFVLCVASSLCAVLIGARPVGGFGELIIQYGAAINEEPKNSKIKVSDRLRGKKNENGELLRGVPVILFMERDKF